MATSGAHDVVCNLVQNGTLELEYEADLDPWYTGLVVSGDMLMVIDWRAYNVQLHRRHDRKLLAKTDKLESGPHAICLINDMEICVILEDGKIKIMSIQCTGDTGIITQVRTLQVDKAFDRCYAAAKFMDKLIVSGRKSDTMICWCIVSLNNEHVDAIHPICKGDMSHLTTKDNMIYISCAAGYSSPETGVYAYDIQNPSKKKFVYTNDELKIPYGITVDTKGFVFVCNNWPPCIHHLSDRCEPVTIYREGMPPYLRAIYWDQQQGQLYVTIRRSNMIHRYTPVYSDQQGVHKVSEDLARDERKQHVTEETSVLIEQRIVDKDQPHVETEILPAEQVLEDSAEDKQGNDPVIPVEILHMDSKSLQLYKEALQDGKEKVYNIRVMVVGQYGVGKTTLTKRLLGKQVDISERKSTEGIDVYKHCCKISLDTGEWIEQYGAFEDSDQMFRLHRLVKLLSGPDQKSEISEQQEGYSVVINKRETTSEVDNTNNDHTSASSGSDINQKVQSVSQIGESPLSKVDERYGVEHEATKKSGITMPVSEEKCRASEKKKEDVVMEILQLVNKNADKLGKGIAEYAVLSMWDFAGQYVFYTTHQTFLTSRAIYLLVIDLHQQVIDVIKDDECFFDMEGIKACKVHELIEIWLNSIHSCAPPAKPGNPPVILVGTHVDKIPEKSRQEFIDKYFLEIRRMLKDKPTVLHLIYDIAIDNTFCDPRFEDLKRNIFRMASQQPHWGEEKPARWLPLEQAIMTLKASGVKVAGISLLEEINNSGSVRIEDKDEMDLFLRFQHEIGTILYFSVEGLRDTIVLDPQWIIGALKSLITAEMFIRENPAIISKWFDFKDKGQLTHELIDAIWTKEKNPDFHDNKVLILLLMEKLNIIARPRSFSEDGKEIKEENYFLAPCMLRQTTPGDIICPKPNDQMESSLVLCYVFLGKFLSSPIFHRLLAVCVAHWPIATKKKEEMQENLIYCGCCVFQLDQYHKLTIHFKEYVIFVRVTRMGIREKTPSSKLCIDVREFITTMLHKIIGYLGQSLKFEHFIQCPEYNGVSINSLIPVSLLKENAEVHCDFHDNIIESSKLLKLWFEDQEKSGDGNASSANPLPSAVVSDTDRFMCIAYLLVDVGSKVLRHLLHHHTVTSTCTLDQYLANNRKLIDKLHNRNILHQSQMDIMFPPSRGNTILETYDITLLSLLFNNIVPTLSPQENNMIKSLREDRNEIYGHANSCKMNTSDYQKYWKSVSSTLMALCKQCGDTDFENEILSEIQRIQVTTIPAGSYLGILRTWFNELQDLKSRVEALESKDTAPKSEV